VAPLLPGIGHAEAEATRCAGWGRDICVFEEKVGILFMNSQERSEPRVTKQEAIEIARRVCKDAELAWFEPIDIRRTGEEWVIRTHVGYQGSNALVRIDCNSGKLIEKRIAYR
jgi:hypothetical protein